MCPIIEHMEEDHRYFTEEQIEKELQYMHLEGLINVEFHPDHPGSYKHAIYKWRSDTEIQAELNAILND